MLAEPSARFGAVQDEVRSRRALGEYGFYGLGRQEAAAATIRRFAEGVGQAFDHVLVLGIGGSALGAKALLDALRPPAWNELEAEAREYFPRLTVLENVDPSSVAAALRRIDPRRVLVNVISKSGGTAETLAQYLVVRDWLERAVGADAVQRHLVFTTDPVKGPLRALSEQEGIASLEASHAVNSAAVTPGILFWGPRLFQERYKLPVVVTENGMSGDDWVHLDGRVHDPQRIDYLHRYLQELARTVDDGVEVRGYFHWTFMDNWECVLGYRPRMGLVHFDYTTQRRTLKDSALWYRDLIASNGRTLSAATRNTS